MTLGPCHGTMGYIGSSGRPKKAQAEIRNVRRPFVGLREVWLREVLVIYSARTVLERDNGWQGVALALGVA